MKPWPTRPSLSQLRSFKIRQKTLHKINWLPYFRALKSWKGRSGTSKTHLSFNALGFRREINARPFRSRNFLNGSIVARTEKALTIKKEIVAKGAFFSWDGVNFSRWLFQKWRLVEVQIFETMWRLSPNTPLNMYELNSQNKSVHLRFSSSKISSVDGFWGSNIVKWSVRYQPSSYEWSPPKKPVFFHFVLHFSDAQTSGLVTYSTPYYIYYLTETNHNFGVKTGRSANFK